MYLDEQTARTLLDLNPAGELDTAITERQFQVILKGFNHLFQPQNNFLYLADEVGLGKTYLALGIMSLFRHFSEHPERHCDLVLVPKKNLQNKWQKEIHQFVRQNYQCEDGLVKSVLGSPASICGSKQLHDRMEPFDVGFPSCQIFRNSSFSQALNREHHNNPEAWDALIEKRKALFQGIYVKGFSLENLFDRAVQVFGREQGDYQDQYWRKLTYCYAYLLNASLPKIDLLVVDEAHNFKGGYLGNDTLRNNAVARFMGIRPSHGAEQQFDDAIFGELPELAELVRPVAKKVLLLSATPLDHDLNDIRQQLDCFLPQHSFPVIQNSSAHQEDHDYLRSVLIRGLMEIKVADKSYSRNMYRQEHRNGNVSRDDNTPQKIESDLDTLILGVMQYRTIRHLKRKNNASFELGMLAGFESFAESNKEKPYEESSAKNNEAVDESVIRSLVRSYQNKFNNPIPHVKQDRLVKELVDRMKRGEKSLVFVRRVASTYELERKIADQYADHINERLEKISKIEQYKSPQLMQMLNAFKQRTFLEDIEATLGRLAERIWQYDSKDPDLKAKFDDFIWKNSDTAVSQEEWLLQQILVIYHSAEDDGRINIFREMTEKHLLRTRMDANYRLLAMELVLEKAAVEYGTDDEDEFENETKGTAYFYTEFFRNNPEGRKFRKRMYERTWYDLNFLLINDKYLLVDIDRSSLSPLSESKKIPEKTRSVKESKKFESRQELIRRAIRTDKKSCTPVAPDSVAQEFTNPTFLTKFLMEDCAEQFSQWLENIRKLFEENPANGLQQIDILNDLLKGIFRNGSGLVPAFIIETSFKGGLEFSPAMQQIVRKYFSEVISEVNVILRDFETICTKNLLKRNEVGNLMSNLEPVAGISGQHKKSVSRTASQFRMPGWPLVLITTDVLKEGEDLHLYCQDVFHYGVAWKASDMDQRNGRVDRIGSLSYRKIKDTGCINDGSMVHVFVPYLSDTLEVNQVSHVFREMDQFIRTFYDFTDVAKQDSSASTDGVVSVIPEQIREKLSSKFDHEQFKADWSQEHPLIMKSFKGSSRLEIQEKLEVLFANLLTQNDKYFYKPILDKSNFRIIGDLAIDQSSGEDRRGPFSLTVVKGRGLGEYQFRIASTICEVRGPKREQRIRIKEELDKYKYSMRLSQSRISAIDTLSLDIEIMDLIQKLKELIFIADKLENEIIGEDLNVF